MALLSTKLPPLYGAFFPSFIHADYPDERWATCHNCTLCQSPKSPYLDTKCCNYYPHLANYLVGGILQDQRPELANGQEKVRALIRQQRGVTPYGLLPPKEYKEQRAEFKATEREGKATRAQVDAIRCPYLDKGACSIWDYRENLCSTHFCLSTGGKTGSLFWKALNRYLKMTENVLSNYALHQVGFLAGHLRTEAIKNLDFDLETETQGVDQAAYDHLWQQWKGREEELYIRCHEVISKLDEATFLSLCGYPQTILQQAIREHLASFKGHIIPEFLQLHPAIQVVRQSLTECELALGDQQLTINPIVYNYIKLFTGQRAATEVIHHAFEVMLSLGGPINELYSKGMLIEARPSLA